MLRYVITILPAAIRQLTALPVLEQKRVAARINGLSVDPRPPGSKKLKEATGLYRIRSGNYRIIYQIQEKRLLILVIKIGHRRDGYR
jgi:mRNA interferase RelE/StbE